MIEMSLFAEQTRDTMVWTCDAVEEGEGERNWKIGDDIYTLPCVNTEN